MNKKLVKSILEFAADLSREGLSGDNGSISVKTAENGMYITKSGVDFANLTDKDVFDVNFLGLNAVDESTRAEAELHVDIYKKRDDIKCVMHTRPKYACVAADAAIAIPPVLDDMAQIVGPTIKVAKAQNSKAILSALKGRGACLIPNGGVITTGQTLHEAYTCCLVADKAAYTFIMATAVGGCQALGAFGARLEHFVYKKKYSKANQVALAEAERK